MFAGNIGNAVEESHRNATVTDSGSTSTKREILYPDPGASVHSTIILMREDPDAMVIRQDGCFVPPRNLKVGAAKRTDGR